MYTTFAVYVYLPACTQGREVTATNWDVGGRWKTLHSLHRQLCRKRKATVVAHLFLCAQWLMRVCIKSSFIVQNVELVSLLENWLFPSLDCNVSSLLLIPSLTQPRLPTLHLCISPYPRRPRRLLLMIRLFRWMIVTRLVFFC